MKVLLRDVVSGGWVDAMITEAQQKEMPLKKDGWQFNWQQLSKSEGSAYYKLTTLEEPSRVEGMLMLTLINGEMMFMNNIEVAPRNFGSSGRYDHVAGSLLAFACYKSFELGENHYLGFLSFESKTKLMGLYQEKYGASIARAPKMFFSPSAGKELMKKHLSIDLQQGEP